MSARRIVRLIISAGCWARQWVAIGMAVFLAATALAQNTFVKVVTDGSGIKGQVLVNGVPAPIFTDTADPQPVKEIPAIARVLVNLGDNGLKRLQIAVDNGRGTMIFGQVVQATAGRERPQEVKVPGPFPPTPPARAADPVAGGNSNLATKGNTTDSAPLALGAALGVAVLAGLGWLIARELRKGPPDETTGGNGRHSHTVHGWPPSLAQKHGWLVPESKITSGGMGTIYVARNTRARGRRSAVKVLHSQLSDAENPEALRFLDEARLLRQLDGTSLQLAPRLYSMTSDMPGPNATLWFEMELLEDWQTLRRHIGGRDRRTLSPAAARALLRKLVTQVWALHHLNIIHRDLSPENVMVHLGMGEMRLIDFGLAKWTGQTYRDGQIRSAHLTQPGEHVGKPRYCAPEQWIQGLATAGPGADWYAVGVMGWEMLMGAPPFETPDEAQRRTVHPAELHARGMDAGDATLIVSLLHPNVNHRLSAAGQLLKRLQGTN